LISTFSAVDREPNSYKGAARSAISVTERAGLLKGLVCLPSSAAAPKAGGVYFSGGIWTMGSSVRSNALHTVSCLKESDFDL
ncbi:MAG: hypothetical protein PQJ28_00090, partial [Spirochaetales bacterium]|nr:hypothetical protein [Spirochaetales bacterium]